jgi:hypothetical protein
MTWLDWARIICLLVAVCSIALAVFLGIFYLLTSPLGNGPERIVDIDNRGRTRIRMPDGRIR